MLDICPTMENIETGISLPQSVEYVDAMCLEKSIILSDGCTTATITTVDGQALPVTFIVSQPLQENTINGQSVGNLIASEQQTSSVIAEQNQSAKIESSNEGPPAVYAVHFPSDERPVTQNLFGGQEANILCENKPDVIADDSFGQDLLSNSENETDLLAPISRLEDFMDVVTTYKCKFCRFSCPWKAGLMSHIRCCHINEKQNVVTVKEEKEQPVQNNFEEDFGNNPEPSELVQSENCDAPQQKCDSEHLDNSKFPESNCKSPEFQNCTIEGDGRETEFPAAENHSQDEEFQRNCSEREDSNPFFENDSENENSSSPGSPVERHIFLCGQCSDGFASLDECKQHMIDDHNLKLDQSEIKPLRKRGRPRKVPKEDLNPEDSITNDNEPKEKKRQSRPPKILAKDYECGPKKKVKRNEFKTFRCSRTGCACKFSSESFLMYHYASHSEVDKSFICQVCNEGFELWRLLVMHLWKDHNIDIDLFACTDCPYKTFSGFKLNNHKKIHSDERSYICETCGKGFKQISQLRNHVVIHLDRKNLPEKRWYSEQICDICGRKFSDAKCLRKHKQAVHKKLKPYVCSFCGHLSARKAMLELHMRQHTGEKPFVCEHCDYRTGDHNSLRRHRMRHTGAKPYKCPHCPYACIQAISYKTHLRNKHPGMEGLYSCNFCSFKSVSKENFLHHVSDHKREGDDLDLETAAAQTSMPEVAVEAPPSDQSSVQMQLTDNAVQQLDRFLPSNVTAAQLIYTCLNALNQDGGTVNLPSGVTVNIPQGVSTLDGTQTITIQLPSGQDIENEPYYFAIQQQDGSTTAVVLPTDEQTDENAQAATDLAGVQFEEGNLTDTNTLNCDVILQDTHDVVHDPAHSIMTMERPDPHEMGNSINMSHVDTFTGAVENSGLISDGATPMENS